MPDEIVELCGHHLLPVASNLSSGHHSEFDSLDVQSYFFWRSERCGKGKLLWCI